jgi:hypothetical protein
MVSFITDTASAEKTDVLALDRISSSKGIVCINLELYIKDIVELRKYISKLKSGKAIESINFF